MDVYTIPPDGNCLFGAIVHQLNIRTLISPNYTPYDLRSDVVQYIRANLNDYVPTLLDSIRIYGSRPTLNQSETQLIQRYLSDLEMDGFWGGAECLSSVARFRQLKIVVHHSNSDHQITFLPECGEYLTEINLLYNGTHYDSMIPHLTPISQFTSTTQSSNDYTFVRNITDNVHRVLYTTNNPYTLFDASPSNPIPLSLTLPSRCFGTWNVRGINTSKKRDTINDILQANNIAICSIQETNMCSGACSTLNYTWYLTQNLSTRRRGVGLLLHKNSMIVPKRIRYYFGSIITLLGHIPNLGEILFIAVYVPAQTSQYNRQQSTRIFTILSSIVDRCPKSCDVVLLGDFNAHLGSRDLWDKRYIGSNLFHSESNANGFSLGLLVNMSKLLVQTNKGRRIIATWTDGQNFSQVDHILIREKSQFIYVNSLKADAFRPSISDHRLIWIKLIRNHINRTKINCTNPMTFGPYYTDNRL